MRAGFRFRQHLSCAFPMPSFRLRHAFVTPSSGLRGSSSNVLGISNLRSDSPVDSTHLGRSYLDSIGGLNTSSTLGSLAASGVGRANAVRGLLFEVASSGQVPAPDPIARRGVEPRDNQLSINGTVHDFSQHWSTNVREEEQSLSETCSATPIKCALVFAQGTMCQRRQKGD